MQLKSCSSGLRLLPLIVAAMLTTACANTEERFAGEPYDPFESVNRKVFDFNMAVDKAVIRPAAQTYVDYVPPLIREMAHNFLENLKSPAILANDLLQGEFHRAGQTVARFTVNTIAGFGGINDVAADMGAEGHDEDFGQTLAVWGWRGGGPYLILPILGPSNPRDAIGTGTEIYFDPIDYAFDPSFELAASRTGTTALDRRSAVLGTLDELERTSLDFYATIRSLYLQKRADEIRNGATTEPVPIPNITMAPDAGDTTPRVGAPK